VEFFSPPGAIIDLASFIFQVPKKTLVAAKHTAMAANRVASVNRIVLVFMQSPLRIFD
jgi:hypothetical protein